jgi:hypothetical protein
LKTGRILAEQADQGRQPPVKKPAAVLQYKVCIKFLVCIKFVYFSALEAWKVFLRLARVRLAQTKLFFNKLGLLP